MREILFRGKRIDNGEWVYGVPIIAKDDIADKDIIVMVDNPNEIAPMEGVALFEQVDPETVGQYTGLTDKNGKKIFDGDIIKAADGTPEYNVIVIRAEGYGFFNDYYFAGEKYDTGQIRGADWFVCDEVNGNIHDTPELLKEREKDE